MFSIQVSRHWHSRWLQFDQQTQCVGLCLNAPVHPTRLCIGVADGSGNDAADGMFSISVSRHWHS